MLRALACFLAAIAWFYAAPAHAEYLGEYDVGDTITLHCVVNDNGTAADSVSGDTIKAIIIYEGTKIDTIGLDPMGATLPLASAFYAKLAADTTVGGYGSWWATLWAVNVGAGTRDPVGVVSWTLYPRIASVSGVVPRVTVSDSMTSGGTIVFCDSTSDVGHVALVDSAGKVWKATVAESLGYAALDSVATNAADGVWRYEVLIPGSVADNAAARVLSDLYKETMAGWYLGQYQQGDTLTIGARLPDVDSAKAQIYYRNTVIDTVTLASGNLGWWANIQADTAGGGFGPYRAVLFGWVDGQANRLIYAENIWSLRDHHVFAQEIAESTDVYVHDPDDSTLALVFRDSLNAWADSFKADTVVAVTNDTFHLNVADWGGLAGRFADSAWTGGANSRTLSAAAYAEIGDSVGTSIAALDTIAYVANVGTVALTDSAGKVGTVTRSILTDSTVAAQRVREVVLPIDSVVASARVWDVDSTRALATAWVVDSARIVASCDSVGKVDTVRAVATVTSLIEDSIRAVGRVDVTDSTVASARNWFTDSTRVTTTVRHAILVDSSTGLARMVNPLDSVVAVARVWQADSLRVARRSLAVTLADSVTGVRRLNGRVDSVSGVYRVAVLDSGVKVATVDSTGRAKWVDSVTAVYRVRHADSTVAVGRARLVDSLRVANLVWDVDSSRATGTIASVDSIRKVATVDSVAKVLLVDTLRAGGRVAAVTLTDSMAAGYRVRFVDDVDSSRVAARVWDADSLRVAGHTILTDSATNLYRGRIVDSTASQASVTNVDSVRAVGIVWDVDSTRALDHARLVSRTTLNDSTVGVNRVLLTSTTSVATVVDSVRAVKGVTGLTTATIASAVGAITAGGTAWPTVLANVESDAQQAVDSLTSTAISTLAHVGDAMTTTGPDKAEAADSLLFSVQLNSSYPFPTVGNIIWNIQEDSLALIQDVAGATADSTRALLAASALSDSLDSLLVRMGNAGGDSSLIVFLRYIKANLNAVTFTPASAGLVADSLLSQIIDTTINSGVVGVDSTKYPDGSVGALIWAGGSGYLNQDFSVIDSSSKDTSGATLGVFNASGTPVPNTEVYVYTYADSGWSQPVGTDKEPAADGRFYVPVYVPANADTVYYRVRFHAPGYIDDTKIVRFPQP